MAQEKVLQEVFTSKVKFETRKTLNRSTKIIDDKYIKEIEDWWITSEVINKIGDPIFKYMSQITVHWIFNFNKSIDYKFCILNKNKSLWIKYNWIDVKKRMKIYKYVKYWNIKWSYNSNDLAFYIMERITEENKEELIKKYKDISSKIDDNLIWWPKHIEIVSIPMYGVFIRLSLVINYIYEENVDKLIEQMTWKKLNELDKVIEQAKIEKEKQDIDWKQKFDERQKNEKEEKNKCIQTINDKLSNYNYKKLWMNYKLWDKVLITILNKEKSSKALLWTIKKFKDYFIMKFREIEYYNNIFKVCSYEAKTRLKKLPINSDWLNLFKVDTIDEKKMLEILNG